MVFALAALPRDLEADLEPEWVPMATAARYLRMSRARLSELVVDGKLAINARQEIRRRDLGPIVPRSDCAEPQRLSRVPDAVLWLLREWRRGTAIELGLALKTDRGSVARTLVQLRNEGFVERVPIKGVHTYRLASMGEQYVSEVEPPM